jgi:pyochelin biosynthetic protein PchC
LSAVALGHVRGHGDETFHRATIEARADDDKIAALRGPTRDGGSSSLERVDGHMARQYVRLRDTMSAYRIDVGAEWLRHHRSVAAPAVRLVCFPHAGAGAGFFWGWREHTPPDWDLYAVQYPGREDRIREPCLTDIPAMADGVASDLRTLLDRPIVLVGHSLGAAVAFEVARRLEDQWKVSPTRLVVSGRDGPQERRPRSHLLDDDGLWTDVGRLGGTNEAVLESADLRALLLPIIRSDYRASEQYTPDANASVSCPITACVGDHDTEVDFDVVPSWAARTSNAFDTEVLPGGHFYLVERAQELLAVIAGRVQADIGERAWASAP